MAGQNLVDFKMGKSLIMPAVTIQIPMPQGAAAPAEPARQTTAPAQVIPRTVPAESRESS